MPISNETLEQIHEQGIRALVERLGPVGMVRFLQQYETGWGDYSKDRHQWLGNPELATIAKGIQNQKP